MNALRLEKPTIPSTFNGDGATRFLLRAVVGASTKRSFDLPDSIVSVSPREDESIDCAGSKWRGPQHAEVVIERFTGQLDCMEGNLAHISLKDYEGEEFVADCDAERLRPLGIGPGDRFFCTILNTPEGARFSYQAAPRRLVSEERQAEIRREVEDALKYLEHDPAC
jgi:hypothetical protein